MKQQTTIEKKRIWKEEEWEKYKKYWLPKFPDYTEDQLRGDFEHFWKSMVLSNQYLEVIPEDWELVAEQNK